MGYSLVRVTPSLGNGLHFLPEVIQVAGFSLVRVPERGFLRPSRPFHTSISKVLAGSFQ
jgi:hypothetical protein